MVVDMGIYCGINTYESREMIIYNPYTEQVCILLYDGGSGDLYLYYANDHSPPFSRELIPDGFVYFTMAMDNSGDIHIYYESGTDNKLYKRVWDGSSLSTSTLVIDDTQSGNSFSPVATIDSSDCEHLIWAGTNQELYYFNSDKDSYGDTFADLDLVTGLSHDMRHSMFIFTDSNDDAYIVFSWSSYDRWMYRKWDKSANGWAIILTVVNFHSNELVDCVIDSNDVWYAAFTNPYGNNNLYVYDSDSDSSQMVSNSYYYIRDNSMCVDGNDNVYVLAGCQDSIRRIAEIKSDDSFSTYTENIDVYVAGANYLRSVRAYGVEDGYIMAFRQTDSPFNAWYAYDDVNTWGVIESDKTTPVIMVN